MPFSSIEGARTRSNALNLAFSETELPQCLDSTKSLPGSGEAQEDPVRTHQGTAVAEALREGEIRERCTAEGGEGEDRGRVARYLRH